jgi:uncharacterized protein
MSTAIRIGLISDTHNLVRPEALEALRGCAQIIHAGDICNPGVLDVLSEIAPVAAVRGNNDFGPGVDDLPEARTVDVGGLRVLVVHDIADVPRPPRHDVVVTGHSHKPLIEERDGVLFVNPGSAGPRRFRLPVTVGVLDVDGEGAVARIIDI